MPVRLHFDVLTQHVEAHLLAGLYVVLQGRVCWCSIDAIWPEALHTPMQITKPDYAVFRTSVTTRS